MKDFLSLLLISDPPLLTNDFLNEAHSFENLSLRFFNVYTTTYNDQHIISTLENINEQNPILYFENGFYINYTSVHHETFKLYDFATKKPIKNIFLYNLYIGERYRKEEKQSLFNLFMFLSLDFKEMLVHQDIIFQNPEKFLKKWEQSTEQIIAAYSPLLIISKVSL